MAIEKATLKAEPTSSGNSQIKKSKFKSYCCTLTGLIVIAVGILLSSTGIFVINLEGSIQADNIKAGLLGEFVPLEGNLKPNELLKSAKYIAHKKLRGPESIVFDKDGFMYTGLSNGRIVRIEKNGEVTKIVQMGDETNENRCDEAHDDPKCGRPLGLRINRQMSTLFVADAYYGIFKVDLIKRTKTLLLSVDDERFGEEKPKFINDLDIHDFDIYFIDTSHQRDVKNFLKEFLESRARGRLFKFNFLTNKLTLLLTHLHFPNGLQLTPEKDALLINENTMARILKFNLNGKDENLTEVFLNLPGHADNIRLTEHGTLFVPFAVLRQDKWSSILDLLGEHPFHVVRNILGHFINFDELFKYLPKYGLLVEYDLYGRKPIRSWHDPSGKIIEAISHAELYNKKLYLGSIYIDYIGVVDY